MVTSTGTLFFPDDVWRVILHHLRLRPKSALFLSWTCKSICKVATADPQYWVDMLRTEQENGFNTGARRGGLHAVSTRIPDIVCHPVPNFKPSQQRFTPPWRLYTRSNRWPGMALSEARLTALAVYYRRILALKHYRRCGLCGAVFHHTPVWSLRMRVCCDCLRENLVSNVVLFHRYGVDYWKHVHEIAGHVFYFFNHHSPSVLVRSFSWDPLDFVDVKGMSPSIFFWRPHLQAVLDLRAREEKLCQHRAAATVLVPRLRRLITHLFVHLQGKSYHKGMAASSQYIQLLRARLLTFLSPASTPVPVRTLIRLREMEALRLSKLVVVKQPQPNAVFFAPTELRTLLGDWEDRLVESEAPA